MAFYRCGGGSKLNQGTITADFSFSNNNERTLSKTVTIDHDVKAVGMRSAQQFRSAGNGTASVTASGKTITITFSRSGSNTDVVGSCSVIVDYWY